MISLKFKIIASLILVVAIYTLVKFKKARKKSSQKKSLIAQRKVCDGKAGETIFVSVPSFRDPECAKTLVDLFQKAQCPHRVYAGVFVQDAKNDPDPVMVYKNIVKRRGFEDYSDQIRTLKVDCSQAKGPMFARAVIEKELFRNERFFLMIDSHTRFCQSWDAECIDQLERCRVDTPYPVLTTYPNDFTKVDHVDFEKSFSSAEHIMPNYLRPKEWCTTTGTLKIEGVPFKSRPQRPMPCLFWGAGFSFSDGSLVKQCPFPDDLPYLFFGEELLMTEKYHQTGASFFSPTRGIVRHKWSRQGRNGLFWDEWIKDPVKKKREKTSQDKLASLMTNTSESYMSSIGVDMTARKHSVETKLGISKLARSDEIVSKFGTIKAYETELEKAIKLEAKLTKEIKEIIT